MFDNCRCFVEKSGLRWLLSGRKPTSERGASLVEYALLVALIALVCFVAVMAFGGDTGDTFSRVGDSVANA